MTVLLIKLIFLITALFVYTIEAKFSWKNCYSSNKILHFNSIRFNQNPVKISTKYPFKLSFDVNLSGPLDNQMIAKISMSKQVGWNWFGFWTELGCYDGFGTCNLDVCSLLTNQDKPMSCTLMKKLGRQCSCPIAKGHLAVNDHDFKVSNLPNVPRWLASGQYWIKMILMKEDKSYGCAEIYVDIEMD